MSEPRRGLDRWLSWIVDRPWLTAALVVLVTGTAWLGYRDPDLIRRHVPRLSKSTAGSSGEAQEHPEIQRRRVAQTESLSITRSDAVLVIQSKQIFSQRGAAALRHVVSTIESLEYVRDVLWMDRVPILNIFGLPEPLFPKPDASEYRFAEARQKALAHPLVGGQLVSADGQTVLVMVGFDWLFVQSDQDCIENLKRVAEQAANDYPDVALRVGITGRVPLVLTAMQEHQQNQFRYQIIGYGMIAVMALVLFRGLTAVLVVALAPSLGVFWTLGIIRFWGIDDNPFNDVVLPVLLSLVGLTDGVHLMVQIRRQRANGLAARDAARAAVQQVGLACGLTSLTTAIGFGSLSLAHHTTVREFGMCCVIGVVLTFFAVVTIIPLACLTRLGRQIHRGHEHSLIDQHLGRVSGLIDWVLARPHALSYAGIATTALCALIALQLRPDERNANALPDDCEPLRALRQMDLAFGGLELGKVELWWSERVPQDSPEILAVVSKVDDLLTAEPLIGHPLSIRNFVDALSGDGATTQRMSLVALLPPPLKQAFYAADERAAEVIFRVQDLGIARYGPVFKRIEAGLEEIQEAHPEFRFEMSGSAVWRWEHLYQIVVDLAASLGSAAVIIFIVLTIAYRSVRIGMISLVPNLFPLAVTGVYLVVTGQALEIVSVCAFTICLGIAVDDSIHFLTRFQEEQRRCGDQREAIRRAFTGVGTALIMTTIILVAGFSTVLFSGLRDHRIFAAMGGLTIAAALFADLIFLPALLACFAKPLTLGSTPTSAQARARRD